MSDDDKKVTETPSTPPVETETPKAEAGESANEISQPQEPADTSDEAVAFNSLSGSAQDRFRYMANKAKEAEGKLEDSTSQLTRQAQVDNQTTQTQGTTYGGEEVQKAVATLKQNGLASTEDLNKLYWAIESKRVHDGLEKEYDGASGGPKYNAKEVEDYAYTKGMGTNYRAAFRDMYFDELADGQRRQQKRRVVTEKPGASQQGSNEPLSFETFREKLRGPKAMEFYDSLAKNPEEMNAIVAELTE